MWRRYGDAAYTLMTLAIFGFETIALGALSLSFLLGSASGIASTPVEGILLGIVISTASALALLGLYLLSYHFISNMRDRWQADQLDTWTEWWVGLALTGPDEPVGSGSDKRRLPRVAVHSVLSLLEAVKGEEGRSPEGGAGQPRGRQLVPAPGSLRSPHGQAGRDRESRQGSASPGLRRPARPVPPCQAGCPADVRPGR